MAKLYASVEYYLAVSTRLAATSVRLLSIAPHAWPVSKTPQIHRYSNFREPLTQQKLPNLWPRTPKQSRHSRVPLLNFPIKHVSKKKPKKRQQTRATPRRRGSYSAVLRKSPFADDASSSHRTDAPHDIHTPPPSPCSDDLRKRPKTGDGLQLGRAGRLAQIGDGVVRITASGMVPLVSNSGWGVRV